MMAPPLSAESDDTTPLTTTPRRMARRALLRAGLGGTVSLLGTRQVGAQLGPGELAVSPRRVLVLGAGMSGLTAALALHRRGHDVQVIEYQNRVGGRLLSVPLKGGQFTEAGGGHFRSNMPLVLRYLRAFALPVMSMNDGLPRYLIDGRHRPGLRSGELAMAIERRRTQFDRLVQPEQVPVPERPRLAISPRSRTGRMPARCATSIGLTVGEMIRGVGGSEAFLQAARCARRNFHQPLASAGRHPGSGLPLRRSEPVPHSRWQ